MAKPLNVLTSKETTYKWGEPEETSFNQLKRLMVEAPVLAYPDPGRPYILDTDASNDAAGAVLSQETEDGQEKVVDFYSKTFSPPQKNYCVTRRELLAVILAVTQ